MSKSSSNDTFYLTSNYFMSGAGFWGNFFDFYIKIFYSFISKEYSDCFSFLFLK